MATEIETQVEAEVALERLFDHLEGWLLQQPEILLLWVQPRNTRKVVEREIARLLTTIPSRDNVEGNRAIRRRILRALEQADREWFKGVKI